MNEETVKREIKALFLDPIKKAQILKRLAESKAETERLKKEREVKWVCTCHKDDFCILHTTFS